MYARKIRKISKIERQHRKGVTIVQCRDAARIGKHGVHGPLLLCYQRLCHIVGIVGIKEVIGRASVEYICKKQGKYGNEGKIPAVYVSLCSYLFFKYPFKLFFLYGVKNTCGAKQKFRNGKNAAAKAKTLLFYKEHAY